MYCMPRWLGALILAVRLQQVRRVAEQLLPDLSLYIYIYIYNTNYVFT